MHGEVISLFNIDHVNQEKNQAVDLLSKKVYDCNVSFSSSTVPQFRLCGYLTLLYFPFTV